MPLGVVIKSSDRHRAKTYVDVDITDQASLDEANLALLTAGYEKCKARPIQNASANGINGALHNPSFRYPNIVDALALVEEGCYLAKGDMSAYFNSFPFADSCRGMFQFVLGHVIFLLLFVFFGLAPAPYYCCTFGAELIACLHAKGIPCIFYVDDYLTAGRTADMARQRLHCIRDTSIAWGWRWNAAKEEIGQILCFTGILINTIRMVLSF